MNIYIEAFNEKTKTENRNALILNYDLACDIMVLLGTSLSKKRHKAPTFEELHPEYAPQLSPELQAIKIKEQLKQFAEGYNKKYAAERKN